MKGVSNADMLQDLSDLSVLGKDNQALLKVVGMDMALLTKASDICNDLAVVLAQANGESGNDSAARETRDKAYSYMKQVVDVIWETGRYVFWRDEDRKKGYVSAYQKRLNQRRKGNDSDLSSPEL